MKRFYLLNHLDYIQKPDEQDEKTFVNNILGRIVKEYREPARNYAAITPTPDDAEALKSDSVIFKELDQFVSQSSSLKLKLLVQKLVGLELETTRLGDRHIKSGTATHHFFINDDAIDRIRHHATVRHKLETWLARGGSRVWVVTGLITAKTVDAGNNTQRTQTTKATLDPAAAASSGAASVELEASGESKQQQHGEAKVERLSVVAVRYVCLQRRRTAPRDAGLVTKLKAGPADFSADGSGRLKVDGREEWEAEVVEGTITDILEDSDELEHEDFGDFSFAFDVEDDDGGETDDGEEDDEEEEEDNEDE